MTEPERLPLKTALLHLHNHSANTQVALDLICDTWHTYQRRWDLERQRITDALLALHTGNAQTVDQIAALLQQLDAVRPDHQEGKGT